MGRRPLDGEFPGAPAIARAVVNAARLFGENPEQVVDPAYESRARYVAYEALREVFPEANRKKLANCLGFNAPDPSQVIGRARQRDWWDGMQVDEVVGALVLDSYGGQAA
jgi:hypothetical protein